MNNVKLGNPKYMPDAKSHVWFTRVYNDRPPMRFFEYTFVKNNSLHKLDLHKFLATVYTDIMFWKIFWV